MTIDRPLLEKLRRMLIMLLNTIDDSLGLPRTVPSKQERRKARRMQG
jgi:hypothetical protein